MSVTLGGHVQVALRCFRFSSLFPLVLCTVISTTPPCPYAPMCPCRMRPPPPHPIPTPSLPYPIRLNPNPPHLIRLTPSPSHPHLTPSASPHPPHLIVLVGVGVGCGCDVTAPCFPAEHLVVLSFKRANKLGTVVIPHSLELTVSAQHFCRQYNYMH